MQDLRHLLHELLVLLLVFGGAWCITDVTITDPKSTAVHLSCDFHDFRTTQFRSDTERNQILNIPRCCLLQGENHRQASACKSKSQQTLNNLFDVCGTFSIHEWLKSAAMCLSCVEGLKASYSLWLWRSKIFRNVSRFLERSSSLHELFPLLSRHTFAASSLHCKAPTLAL